MIRRIYPSEIDRHNLSKYKTVEEKNIDKCDYRGLVVPKPWGYEYLMYENEFVAIWILHLKKNHATSMHCHPKKKTSLVVLSGRTRAYTLNEWFELESLNGLVYEEGVFHTCKALTDDVFLMETESPSNKKDLVRLKDMYGRENEGYESEDKFIRSVKKYNYLFFNKKETNEKKFLNKVLISIKKSKSNYLHEEIDYNKKKIYCILEEMIVESKYKSIFGVGNIFDRDHLKDQTDIRLLNNCLLLTLESC